MMKSMRWMRQRITSYAVIAIGAIVAFVALTALVGLDKLSTELGSFVGTLLAGLLTVIFIAEVREDRIAQHRPIVAVEIEDLADRIGTLGGGEVIVPIATRLIVRNHGLGVATRIKIVLSEPFATANGEALEDNPMIREGIPFLGPGREMGLTLRLLCERTPPIKPLTTEVSVTYEDAATGRGYRESYPLLLAPHASGWTVGGPIEKHSSDRE